jgi:hypothetical protein
MQRSAWECSPDDVTVQRKRVYAHEKTRHARTLARTLAHARTPTRTHAHKQANERANQTSKHSRSERSPEKRGRQTRQGETMTDKTHTRTHGRTDARVHKPRRMAVRRCAIPVQMWESPGVLCRRPLRHRAETAASLARLRHIHKVGVSACAGPPEAPRELLTDEGVASSRVRLAGPRRSNPPRHGIACDVIGLACECPRALR